MEKRLVDFLSGLSNKIISKIPAGATPLIGNINVFVVVQTNDDIDVSVDTEVDTNVNTQIENTK